MVDVASLAIAVRLATIDERFKCSVCELLLPRTQFTPFHRVVNEQRRMCTACRGLYRRKLYWSTRRMFAELPPRDLFEAIGQGNFAYLHDACVFDDTVERAAAASKQKALRVIDPTTGRTPLHEACSRGELDCCELLVEAGADVNRKSLLSAETPVFMAVCADAPLVVLLLLLSGADGNARDRFGGAPAHYVRSAAVAAVLHHVGRVHWDVLDRRGRDPATCLKEHLAAVGRGVPAGGGHQDGDQAGLSPGAGSATVAFTAGGGVPSGSGPVGSGAARPGALLPEAPHPRRRVSAAAPALLQAVRGAPSPGKSGAGSSSSTGGPPPLDTDDVVLYVSRVLGEERLANALLREEERVRREKIEQEYVMMLDAKRLQKSALEVRLAGLKKVERWTLEYKAWRRGERLPNARKDTAVLSNPALSKDFLRRVSGLAVDGR